MGRHAKTQAMLDVAIEVLTAHNPMTVRQVYYQLVSRQVIENSRSQYQAVSNLLVEARRDGSIPWQWIEDRLRRPRPVQMWDGLSEFAETVRRAYRRGVFVPRIPGHRNLLRSHPGEFTSSSRSMRWRMPSRPWR